MAALMYRLGMLLRESGQALERVGARLQGNYGFLEEFSRHRSVMNLATRKPALGQDAFVAPSASVIGEVSLGARSSVWYGCVLRGDEGRITVGSDSNLQDGTVVRTSAAYLDHQHSHTVVGNNVTIGHNVVLGACTVEDESLIGMGATLAEGVTVERGAMVAAGAVLPAGTRVPAGQLWGGNPARFLRNLKPEEASFMTSSAQHYARLAAQHSQETSKPLGQ